MQPVDAFLSIHREIAKSAQTVVKIEKARPGGGPYKMYWYRGNGEVRYSDGNEWIEVGTIMDFIEPEIL